MEDADRLAAVFVGSRTNTVLSWIFVSVLAASALGGVATGRYEAVLFGLVAIAIVVAPAAARRDPTVMPPWYFLVLLCLPVLWGAFAPFDRVTPLVPSLSLATLGLLLMVDLHRFTTLRLVPWFAVVLTVILTLALAAGLNVLRWSSDLLFGTPFLLDGRTQEAINDALMVEFVYVTGAGALGGLLFWRYFRGVGRSDRETAPSASPGRETPADAAVVSDRLGVSTTRQRLLARTMQAVLVGILVYGVWARQLTFLVNAGVALAITFVPAALERDYGIPIEPGLALWVTGAVFLHALGSAGLYDLIPPWDTLTHTFSATVVAAAGYATLRAIHLHAPSVNLPPWATFALTLAFVLAMGVVWELLEFVVDRGALLLGLDPVLAQRGIDDTMGDLVFDGVGAVLVATWGTVYLVGLSERLALRLERGFDG